MDTTLPVKIISDKKVLLDNGESLQGKLSIERFIQLVFAIWTGILLAEMQNPPAGLKKKSLGKMVDHIKL